MQSLPRAVQVDEDVREQTTRAVVSALFRHADCYSDITRDALPRLRTLLLGARLPLSRHFQVTLARHEHALAIETHRRHLPSHRLSREHAMLRRFALHDASFLRTVEARRLQEWACKPHARKELRAWVREDALCQYEMDETVSALCKGTVALDLAAVASARAHGAPSMWPACMKAAPHSHVLAGVSGRYQSSPNCFRLPARMRSACSEWPDAALVTPAAPTHSEQGALDEDLLGAPRGDSGAAQALSSDPPAEGAAQRGHVGRGNTRGGRVARTAARALSDEDLEHALSAVKHTGAALVAHPSDTSTFGAIW